MTENPNTPPDPNAGPPPGGTGGRAAEPTTPEPGPSTPATPATPAASSTPATPPPSSQPSSTPTPVPTEKSEAEVASEAAATADRPGSDSEPPVTQNPATGSFAANPWAEPGDGETETGGPADPNAPNTGVAATFLPGIDAAAVLALVLAALAAGVYVLVNPLVQAHDAARTWSDFKNNVPRTKQDPFGVQRDWVSYQSWGHIILGLVAVLLALLVLGMWTAQRNKLRSRAFAQAALVLGLAVVLYGILLKTGAVGSEIPSVKEISNGLSSSQSQ